MYKQIGKLKNKSVFTYCDKEYRITKSGYGTGKYVSVEFKSTDGIDDSTYSLPKRTDVEIK